MIKGLFFALALVAGLTVLTIAEEKDAEYFGNLLHDMHARMINQTEMFVNGLAFNLLHECDDKNNARLFARDLLKPGSEAETCAKSKLADPEVIINILYHVPQKDALSLDKFLGRIQSRRFSLDNEELIKELLYQSDRICTHYIDDIKPFFRKVKDTSFVNSVTFTRVYVARNACRVYVDNEFYREHKRSARKIGDRAAVRADRMYAKELTDEETRRIEREFNYVHPSQIKDLERLKIFNSQIGAIDDDVVQASS